MKIHEQQKEWAIKAAAGVATFLFCYIVMIHPVFRDIGSAHQKIAESQNRRELYREVQGLKEELDSSESALATLTERSQLLGKISDIAGRTQLLVETLTPRTEPDGSYVRLKMEMRGQGNFFLLLKFLQAVEKIGSAINVRDVSLLWNASLASQKGKGQYPLQIQLEFETLLKQRVKKNNG